MIYTPPPVQDFSHHAPHHTYPIRYASTLTPRNIFAPKPHPTYTVTVRF